MWLTDGRTDGWTDERHTIIRPKFNFGRIKKYNRRNDIEYIIKTLFTQGVTSNATVIAKQLYLIRVQAYKM